MKNTGVTLITGSSGSGKTTLLNLFIANQGEEKLHLFIEEDLSYPLDTLRIADHTTVTPFSLGHEERAAQEVEFDSLMDLALEALRPTQFLCEIRDTSSLPRVLLEMTRAGVVNVRLITCLDGPDVDQTLVSDSWFTKAAAVSDAIWLHRPTSEALALLEDDHGDRLYHDPEKFTWFPVLKGWRRPADLLSQLDPISTAHPWHTLEYSTWGTFDLAELTAFLESIGPGISRVKGTLFCKSSPEEEPRFYTLSGKNGTFAFDLCNFEIRMGDMKDEEELLKELGQVEEEEPYIDGSFLRSSLSLRLSAEASLEEELALTRSLEAIWHFEVPWEPQEPLAPEEVQRVLTDDLDSFDPDWAITLCHEGLQSDTPALRAPFHERLGLLQLEMEDLYNALTHARFTVALGTSAGTLEEMARCCSNLDNYPYAVRLLEKALELQPTRKSALQNIIRLHLVYGYPQKGLPYLERVMELYPEDWENTLLSSYVFFETDQYERLLALYESHTDACNASSDFLLTLSSAHLDHGNTRGALALLDRLYEMDSENDGILYLQGYALLVAGEMERARDTLIKAIAMGNGISWVYLALGLALEYLGDKKEAHRTLQKAFEVAQEELQEDPTYSPFVEVSILTHIAVGEPEKAQKIMESAGHDMSHSHEFRNFVKLLSCFKLPEGLATS